MSGERKLFDLCAMGKSWQRMVDRLRAEKVECAAQAKQQEIDIDVERLVREAIDQVRRERAVMRRNQLRYQLMADGIYSLPEQTSCDA